MQLGQRAVVERRDRLSRVDAVTVDRRSVVRRGDAYDRPGQTVAVLETCILRKEQLDEPSGHRSKTNEYELQVRCHNRTGVRRWLETITRLLVLLLADLDSVILDKVPKQVSMFGRLQRPRRSVNWW